MKWIIVFAGIWLSFFGKFPLRGEIEAEFFAMSFYKNFIGWFWGKLVQLMVGTLLQSFCQLKPIVCASKECIPDLQLQSISLFLLCPLVCLGPLYINGFSVSWPREDQNPHSLKNCQWAMAWFSKPQRWGSRMERPTALVPSSVSESSVLMLKPMSVRITLQRSFYPNCHRWF